MVTTRTTTAAELYAMGSDAPYELLRGELVEVSPASRKSNLVLNFINWELYGFVRANELGRVYVAEAGFVLEAEPDSVVAPDIAFVARGRLPEPVPDEGYAEVVPDLIVEIISPSNEPGEIRRKQALYDRVGVPLVWWIDPVKETARIYRHGQSAEMLDRGGMLLGESVLPGFTLSLERVFTDY